MQEKIKIHLDAIAKEVKGTKHAFLFLMVDGEQIHAVKNCSENDTAALMVKYIEGRPEVEQAFTNHVMALQEAEQSQDDSSETKEENQDN